jgi:hypothetical protein
MQQQQKRKEKKLVVLSFSVATNITAKKILANYSNF